MTRLTINSVDFSERINPRSYSVQRVDEYAQWIDGNWHQRRDIARTRATGKFNMTFLSVAQYQAFLAAIAAVKQIGGYCTGVQLWVDNTKQLETMDAFIEFSAKTVAATDNFGGNPAVFGVSVKVTER